MYVGHDLPSNEWAEAIEQALKNFAAHPFILQRFEKSKLFEAQYVDFEANEARSFAARVRLCPYYFVVGDDAKLGGILATICPANKKILHGMPDAGAWRRAVNSSAGRWRPARAGLRLTLWQSLVYGDDAFVGTPTAGARA